MVAIRNYPLLVKIIKSGHMTIFALVLKALMPTVSPTSQIYGHVFKQNWQFAARFKINYLNKLSRTGARYSHAWSLRSHALRN